MFDYEVCHICGDNDQEATILREVLFTCKNGEVVRVKIALQGNLLNPPKFLQFRGKLYQSKGSGLSCNFYHEVESFAVVECDNTQRKESK